MGNESTLKELRMIKRLLLVMVIPLGVYLLKLLSFIFIPLVCAIFAALLFMPLMRWFQKRNLPRFVSLALVILLIILGLKGGSEIIRLTSKEFMNADTTYWTDAAEKVKSLVLSIESFFGVDPDQSQQRLNAIFKGELLSDLVYNNLGSAFTFIQNTLSMTLMTIFFLILLLAGSMDIQKIMKRTIFKERIIASVKTYKQIEHSIVKFIIVKFLLSLFTGLFFGLACVIFDVSFPLFWAVFTFGVNFIQMIGSFIAAGALSIFALAEMEPTGTLLMFVLILIGIQALFGGVLEPILMGKSFSINTITVLVMLMLWGFIWGIPGLILSIPITVFVKTILEQFPKTRVISEMMT